MTATHNTNCTASNAPVLYMALDLGVSNWKLAFTVGLGQKPRLKTIAARSTLSLVLEIKAAKRRFGLPEDAPEGVIGVGHWCQIDLEFSPLRPFVIGVRPT